VFRVRDSGFVFGFGFWARGSGFGFGFEVWSFRFLDLGFGVSGMGFRV
jgi:hypothetical protein